MFVWLQVKTDCLPSSTFLLTKVHGSLIEGPPNFNFSLRFLYSLSCEAIVGRVSNGCSVDRYNRTR